MRSCRISLQIKRVCRRNKRETSLACPVNARPTLVDRKISNGRSRRESCIFCSRVPITTLQNLADARGKLYIWDNSNIAESYSGITLPLTFSFARYIYTEVYRQFCLLLNVPSKRIAQHRALFGQMLGSIRGRVYYNLISWYKVLALLPGYSPQSGVHGTNDGR